MLINEKLEAETLLENRAQIFNHDFYKHIYLLSKYWYTAGKDRSQIMKDMEELFESVPRKKLDQFSLDRMYEGVDKIVRNVTKHGRELIMVDSVSFTQPEIETIRKLRKQHQRLAFVILYHAKMTQAKYGKDVVWLNDGVSTYGSIAGINRSMAHKYILMSDLEEQGLITLSDSLREYLYRVNYITEGEKVFKISNLHNDKELIMYFYKYVIGDKRIAECEECGILIRKTGKNHKHCQKCRKKRDAESARNTMKAKRKMKC